MSNKINISSKEQILIIYIVLAVITLAVYWQINQYDFVFDDVQYVTNNYHVKSGITLRGLHWAFTNTTSNLWHPLTWLSLMLDYQFFGLNAGGFHMNNLILHMLSTLMLFWLFNRMTGAVWKSAFVAAFFALHPLHVESIAWITERKDVLSAFFWMLTLCLYVYYTEKTVIERYILVLFSFVLALLSKPIGVILPVIMILLDYWPLKRFQSQRDKIVLWQLKEKAPFFILSVVFGVVAIYLMRFSKEIYLPLSSRLANAPVAFIIYMEKTFWPHDMAAFYPFPDNIPAGKIIGATFLIIIVSAIIIVLAKRLPYLFTGWLWYAVVILPIIGIIQNGYYAMADRYHYLPSIGIAVMLAWGVPSLIKRGNIRKKILLPAGMIILMVLAFLTWRQNSYWKNNIELWKHALMVTDNNYVAHNNLGVALIAENKITEAIGHYTEAIKLKNSYYFAYNNRGNAYAGIGKYQHAIADYDKAINLNSNYIQAYYNRGYSYNKINQYERAIEDYNKVIFMKQDYADAYNNRGNAYAKIGEYQRAISDYNKAINLNPYDMQAYFNRIKVYFACGDNITGCRDARKACESGNCEILESAKERGLCH
ncbi:MAG: tetratricopeptide repeat protein [Syntrophaceae bacterium]|nr:tetratricopeptide repeat protein [Syntrophaceae bacterium]